MKKVFDQIGADPWDYEIDQLRVEQGMNPWDAKDFVIMKWMQAGDFRPLLAQIKREGVLRGSALGLLVRMLQSGQLVLKNEGRGRPDDPEAAVRDDLAAYTYEDLRKEVASADLFRELAKVAGVSEESVRMAVANARRSRK
jgi:hypothetical protein